MITVAGCSPKDKRERLLTKSLSHQIAVLCPGVEFQNDGLFEERAREFNLSADNGDVEPDRYVNEPLTESTWVALNNSGSRVTVWRGKFAAGRQASKRVTFVYAGTPSYAPGYDNMSFSSGVSCVIHDAKMTRSEGVELAKSVFGEEFQKKARRYTEVDDYPIPRTTGYFMVTGENSEFWYELELLIPTSDDRGVTYIRRFFVKD